MLDKNKCYTDFFKNAQKIYDFLEDDISKNVFLKRLEYNITGSNDSMQELIKHTSDNVRLNAHLQHFSKIEVSSDDIDNTIIIYGAGKIGTHILPIIVSRFPSATVLFCDKNHDKIGEICGHTVISPDMLFSKYSKSKVIIATTIYFNEIYDFLLQSIDAKNIFTCVLAADKDCYFVFDIMKPQANEIFIDAGVYNGDTSLQFAKWCNDTYKKIYLFEPDGDRIDTIKEKIAPLHNTELHSVGLWSHADTLHFAIAANGGSHIVEKDGDFSIAVDSIDNVCGGDAVTFIKMDIEGAELEALMGAKQTILKHKPKLAICLYHNPWDILEIPLYIKELLPEYKIYIRHHTSDWHDTVLYAVT